MTYLYLAGRLIVASALLNATLWSRKHHLGEAVAQPDAVPLVVPRSFES